MMDQSKTESSRLVWFVGAVLVYGIIVSLLNGAANEDLRDALEAEELKAIHGNQAEVVEVTDVEQFQAVIADGDHDTNTCFFATTTLFNEKVQVVYREYNPEDKVAGRWNPNTNTIELMRPVGFNVQTVSHEVSHMVDDFMAQQPTLDPHFEAYMQGFWTWCVYEIMKNDTGAECADDPFCNAV